MCVPIAKFSWWIWTKTLQRFSGWSILPSLAWQRTLTVRRLTSSTSSLYVYIYNLLHSDFTAWWTKQGDGCIRRAREDQVSDHLTCSESTVCCKNSKKEINNYIYQLICLKLLWSVALLFIYLTHVVREEFNINVNPILCERFSPPVLTWKEKN